MFLSTRRGLINCCFVTPRAGLRPQIPPDRNTDDRVLAFSSVNEARVFPGSLPLDSRDMGELRRAVFSVGWIHVSQHHDPECLAEAANLLVAFGGLQAIQRRRRAGTAVPSSEAVPTPPIGDPSAAARVARGTAVIELGPATAGRRAPESLALESES